MGHEPSEADMGWFVVLWDSENKKDILKDIKVDGDESAQVVEDCMKYPVLYSSYEDFKSAMREKTFD